MRRALERQREGAGSGGCSRARGRQRYGACVLILESWLSSEIQDPSRERAAGRKYSEEPRIRSVTWLLAGERRSSPSFALPLSFSPSISLSPLSLRLSSSLTEPQVRIHEEPAGRFFLHLPRPADRPPSATLDRLVHWLWRDYTLVKGSFNPPATSTG